MIAICTEFVPSDLEGRSAAGQEPEGRYSLRLEMYRSSDNADQPLSDQWAVDQAIQNAAARASTRPHEPRVVPDLYPAILKRLGAALGFIAAFALMVTVGTIGRYMLDLGYDLLGWIWSASWVGIVACGCWYWCDRAKRRRGHE